MTRSIPIRPDGPSRRGPSRKAAIRASILILASLSVIGCREGWEADYSKLGLVEVSGKVTLDGQPLANVTVIFEAEDKTYSFGKTDSSGKYRLMFDSEKSGVLPGPKTVRVRPGSVGEGGEAPDPDGAVGGKEKRSSSESVPSCYNSKSQLKLTVDKSRSYDFSLKSDCTVQGPD